MRKGWIVGLVGVLAVLTFGYSAQPPGLGAGGSGWERFSAKFDENQDGQVTREEFERLADPFGQLDRNDDGVLTEEDFPGRGCFRAAMGHRIVVVADANRDGEVTADEWQELLAGLDPDGDGVITDDELAAYFADRRPEGRGRGHGRGPLAQCLDQDGDGELETADLDAIFAELDANGDGTLQSDERPAGRGRGFRHRGR
jgi:Ca2+-binding EF-hand superfamily protein